MFRSFARFAVFSHGLRLGGLFLLALLGTVALINHDWQDREQQRICEQLIPWFERSAGPLEQLSVEFLRQPPHTVLLHYRSADGQHWLRCQFAGSGFARSRLHLVAVESDREGLLAPWQLSLLRGLWLGYFERYLQQQSATAAAGFWRPWLYLLQQLLNALPLGCIYALVACGYSLVFALTGRVNLAFGELASWGALSTVLSLPVLAAGGQMPLPLLLLLLGLIALLTGAVGGRLLERFCHQPFVQQSATHNLQAPLVVSLGLLIAAAEYARLVFGNRDLYLQPIMNQVLLLTRTEGFTVSFSLMQLVVVYLSLVLIGLLLLTLRRSRFGRLQRACADDAEAARLLGVDTRRVAIRTFQLGAVYAASAGCIMALYYGVVNFHMGLSISLKGLAAVIIGGIGSVPGAFLGGLLIALLETLWSAYASIAYRDVAVFAVLIGFLVLRPQGLLGLPDFRKQL